MPAIIEILKTAGKLIQINFLMLFVFLIAACTSFERHDTGKDALLIGHFNKKATHFLLSNPDSVLHYTAFAMETAGITDNHDHDKMIHYLRGHAFRMKGNLQTSLNELLKANSLIRPGVTDSLDGEIYLLTATVYTELGQYDAALGNYHNAIKTFEKTDHQSGVGKSLNNIALIYYRISDLEKADEYNTQAMHIWDKIEFPRGLASSHTIKAYILAEKQQYDSALILHETAQQLYLENGFKHLYANSYLNIGDVYLKMGRYKLAELSFLRSLELSKERTYLQIYVDGLNKLGQSLTRQASYTEARDTLFAGLEIAREINDQALLAEFYNHIAELYYDMNDLQNAYSFQQEHEKHKEAIFQNERALRIAEYQVIYQTEQMQKKNRELEIQNQRRLIYIYFSSAFLVLILLLIILIYSRYRIRIKYLKQQKALNEQLIQHQKLEVELKKNQNEKLSMEGKLKEEENAKLQMEIMHRHNELSSVTMHIYQKNESLSKLLDEVERIEQKARPEIRHELKRIKLSIRQNLQLDEDWDRFKIHFNQVHQGFIERLAERYSNLTNHDLRHCSYIKMNLSTKEISRLMNISPASVQKARVRLKKKLELSQDDDLFEFIMKY